MFGIIIFEILVGRNTPSIGETFGEIVRPLCQMGYVPRPCKGCKSRGANPGGYIPPKISTHPPINICFRPQIKICSHSPKLGLHIHVTALDSRHMLPPFKLLYFLTSSMLYYAISNLLQFACEIEVIRALENC